MFLKNILEEDTSLSALDSTFGTSFHLLHIVELTYTTLLLKYLLSEVMHSRNPSRPEVSRVTKAGGVR